MSKVSSVGPVTLLALLLVAPTSADPINLFSNPGFETGSFDPWYLPSGGDDKGRDESEWYVSNEGAHSGQYCVAGREGPNVTYDFDPPVPTDDITSLSFWIQRPVGGMGILTIHFGYADGGFTNLMVPPNTDEQWQYIDVSTSEFEPGSELSSFSFGGLAPPTGILTRWDDFTLTVVPEPGSLALLALLTAALGRRSRVRGAAETSWARAGE